MIIFLYGEDTFRSIEKMRVMRDAFKAKFDSAGMNLLEIDFAKKMKLGRGGSVLGEVMQAVQSPPFLSEKRMVVLKGLLEEKKKKADAEPWIAPFENVPESTIVIVHSGLKEAAAKRHSFVKAFDGKEGVHTYSFDLMKGAELSRWVEDSVRALGGGIDANGVRLLVEASGGSLWMLRGEIDKLVSYAHGEVITGEMVQFMGCRRSDDVIFPLMDAISQGRSGSVLRLLAEQRRFGAHDIYLLTMLARQIRLLLAARAFLDGGSVGDFSKESGVHGFVAKKVLGQARGIASEDVSRWHDCVYAFDLKAKTGGIAPDVAVDLLVADMVSSTQRS
jgi:DNA polymerase-3 subunit delta